LLGKANPEPPPSVQNPPKSVQNPPPSVQNPPKSVQNLPKTAEPDPYDLVILEHVRKAAPPPAKKSPPKLSDPGESIWRILARQANLEEEIEQREKKKEPPVVVPKNPDLLVSML
jgi:hypothetical protein